MAEKVAAKVAEHDAANRKAADETAEEAELQARIAATTKPLPVNPQQANTQVPPLNSAAVMPPSGKPKTGPDGEPLPQITREQKLAIALDNLVRKLALISAHPDFKAVFAAAVAQNLPLDFPNWKNEVDVAKALLE